MKLRGRKVIVTGGAGFIGSHLTEQLLRLGAKVVVIDNFSTGKRENLAAVENNKNLEIVEADVNQLSPIEKVFNEFRPDYVFHYAALVGVKRVEENPMKFLDDINGIENILKLSLDRKVKKLVFASSSEVYGEPVSLPEKEDGVNNPRDIYALVKLIGEHLVKIYYTRYHLPTVALRFFNVYGPRQESSPYGFVVAIFIREALAERDLTIFGDGLQTRDFTFINDNVEAGIRALLSEQTNGKIINIGSGKATTILDLAKKIIELSGKNLKLKFLPERKLDIRYRLPDIARMKKLLDFTPQYSLDEGLKITYDWYQENL